MSITVFRGRSTLATIERDTFQALVDESWQREAKEYLEALDTCRISFGSLTKLSRAAEIPYSLFFAPPEVVEYQLKRKRDTLLGGVKKGTFSLNSRGDVALADIELIIKDILRKQDLIKRLDPDLPVNPLVASLARPKRSVDADANWLCAELGIDRDYLLRIKTKELAFEHVVDRLEDRNIFVSQSMRNYMPQKLPKRVRFSGVCIKDKKVPFLFINTGAHRDTLEPAGRRLLTLALLLACLARGKFKPVAYSDQADELISNREYELAEEILMPARSVAGLRVDSLDDAKDHADTFCVTPSAFLMRARRLKMLDDAIAREYLGTLRDEFRARPQQQGRQPLPVNALRKYNSAEYSRSLLRHMDGGSISRADVTRVLLQNRRSVSMDDFRAALR